MRAQSSFPSLCLAAEPCTHLTHNSQMPRFTIHLLIASMLTIAVRAQTADDEWQRKAIQKYPDLGSKGSALNSRFIDEYKRRHETSPGFFADPKWPLILADELAVERRVAESTVFGETSPSAIWREFSPATKVAVYGFLAIAVLGICDFLLSRFTRWCRFRKLRADFNEYFAIIKKFGGLPTVPTHINLKQNEKAFYYAQSALYETRAVRHSTSGFASFRVAKGIWIGGSQGRSTSSQEWTKIDAGTLTVTNQRIVFDGTQAVRSLPVGKVISVEPRVDAIELTFENRQKTMILQAANPLILAGVIQLSMEVTT